MQNAGKYLGLSPSEGRMSKRMKKMGNAAPRKLYKRQVRQQQRQAKQARQRWFSILVVVLLVGAAAVFIFRPRADAPVAAEVAQSRLALNPSKGPEVTAVTITEYGDFGCPSCRAWHQAGIIEQILEFYGDQVRFVWRDFPVITGRSPKAAEAGQCAFDQDEFWAYHDNVYEQPDSVVDLRVDALKRYAAEIGLDTEVFDACLDSGQHQLTVQVDWDEGRRLGLRGTPSFLVNDTYVIGGQPELIVQAIDQALAGQ